MLLALAIGLIAIPVLLLLEQPYLSLYNINDTTRQIAHGMILCTCFMMPMQTIAYVTSKGILRGGGDTRFLLAADSSLVWLVSLPLGALAGWLVLRPFMNGALFGVLFAGVAGIMVFISFDGLLPAAREYGEHHLSLYGLIAGMALMAVSLLLFL